VKNKILKKAVFLSIFLCFAFSIALVFAQNAIGTLEITYPTTTTGISPPQSVKTFLPNYIRYIYHFLIISGGIIAN